MSLQGFKSMASKLKNSKKQANSEKRAVEALSRWEGYSVDFSGDSTSSRRSVEARTSSLRSVGKVRVSAEFQPSCSEGFIHLCVLLGLTIGFCLCSGNFQTEDEAKTTLFRLVRGQPYGLFRVDHAAVYCRIYHFFSGLHQRQWVCQGFTAKASLCSIGFVV